MAAMTPRDAMYVGDLYEIDAVGAREAGLHGVWLNRGTLNDHEHAPPIISGLRELARVVDARNAMRG
jgi:putative hydrolase of the HAD superfamily